MSIISHALILSRATIGIDAPLVEVETHLSNGLPKFTIVGLAETTVKESKERVRSALMNSGFEFPHRRITVNLAPADLPKEGGRFDLPIALSILKASHQIKFDAQQIEFAGELSLSGQLRAIKGVLPMAIQAKRASHCLMLATENALHASIVKDLDLYGANHLLEVIAHLCKTTELPPYPPMALFGNQQYEIDLKDVIGQEHAKRALMIAASGGHHMLMSGPPGTGKTMLASRLNTILPRLTEQEFLEKLAIESLVSPAGTLSLQRAFRQPHHTASAVAMVGGGSTPQPGEISLAHHGVLFLDELPEFKRGVLEVLREPIESGEIHISRAKAQARFPARFQLIAAMNPCPCGYLGDKEKACRCTPSQINQYQNRLSGPFLDRIDIHTQVVRLKQGLLLKSDGGRLTSSEAQKIVVAAREIQLKRQGKANANLKTSELNEFCKLDNQKSDWLAQVAEQLSLSPRTIHKVLKVARTIGDLNQEEAITKSALLEALSFRLRSGHNSDHS